MNEQLEQIKLEKLKLLEEKARVVRGLPHIYGFKDYKWSREFLDSNERTILLTAANQLGKVEPYTNLIPTPDGLKPMGEIGVGAAVYGWDGKPTKVVNVFPHKQYPFYRVTFNDGASVVVGEEHKWVAKGSKERFRKGYESTKREWANPEYGQWKVYTTREMVEQGGYSPEARSNYKKFSIPVCDAVEYAGAATFDPYFVGLMLGDGHFGSRVYSYCSMDEELLSYVEKYTHKVYAKRGSKAFDVKLKKIPELEVFRGQYSADKEIPEEYLLAPIEDRKALLAGLLDTDGTVSAKGDVIEFYTISEKLRDGFVRLVTSLGGMCQVKVKKTHYKKNGVRVECADCYKISVWMTFNPFRLERKRSRFKLLERVKHERVISRIEFVGLMDGQCIEVDNSTHTYLTGPEHIVTHNSTTQIRKVVDYATNVQAWPYRFKRSPRQFWYLYPTAQIATAEFHTKWKPDILPKDSFKDDPQYGWRAEFKNRGDISAIYFNSGVALYFKTYAQDAQHLQAGTVDYVACDEELPLELWDEINFRRNAVDGHFSMVFTATLGQEFWRLAMEPKQGEQEAMPFAKKLRASLFDCQFFMDGTPSHWTLEKINRTIAMCKSEAEVQRRVYGRFVKDEGLKYPSFDRARNIVSPSPVPAHWPVYVGVDIGAGGDENHPSAITFVTVRPDYKYARIFRHWRGDDKVYTMSDVASKYMELSQDLNVTAAFYDYHAKDFKTITDRMGLSFIPAEKKHDVGEQIINVLFKNGMLEIEGTVENQPIVNELLSLQLGTDKRKAKDDSVDSMRYALTKIPFDFSHVGYVPVREVVRAKQLDPHEIAQAERNKDRLRMFASGEKSGLNEVQDEIRDWNEIIGADTTHYEDFF